MANTPQAKKRIRRNANRESINHSRQVVTQSQLRPGAAVSVCLPSSALRILS